MSAPSSKSPQSLLAQYRRELREYDARPAEYKPRWQITDAGAALLLHREIEAMDRPRDAVWGGAE